MSHFRLKKEDRVKLADHFYLDEFIHPEIYRKFGKNSTLYLNVRLLYMVVLIRDKFNESRKAKDPNAKEIGIYMNTWANGGGLKNSAVRCFYYPHKKGSWSRHYLSLCLDMHLSGGGDERELYDHILEYDDFYFSHGLTTIEGFDFTPNHCHISLEFRPFQEKIRIIKP